MNGLANLYHYLSLKPMKQTAYILTLLMLFSIAQPFVVDCQAKQAHAKTKVTGCCKKNTCNKKEKEEPAKDCDKTTSCNPFAGCSLCQYIAASKYTYSPYVLNANFYGRILNNDNVLAGFSNNCWRPPKFSLA
jgi:hypothetical protein